MGIAVSERPKRLLGCSVEEAVEGWGTEPNSEMDVTELTAGTLPTRSEPRAPMAR